MPRHRKRGSGKLGRINFKVPDMDDVNGTIEQIIGVALEGVSRDHEGTLTADRAHYLLAEIYLRRAHDRVVERLSCVGSQGPEQDDGSPNVE